MQRNIALLISLLTVFGAGSSNALELQPTPIQSEVSGSLQMEGRSYLSAADETWISDDQPQTEKRVVGTESRPGRKSVLKAAALSALLPGLGQLYNDRGTKARYFFAAEAVAWAAFGAFRVYGDWKADDFVQFASVHAGARLEGKDDEFEDWVGFYDDISDFNAAGRVGDPDRPYLYDTPDNHWHWDSAVNREAYRTLKNSSREAHRRAEWMIWGALLNRAVSVVEAVIDARNINASVAEGWEFGGIRYDLNINPMSETGQVSLTVYPGF